MASKVNGTRTTAHKGNGKDHEPDDGSSTEQRSDAIISAFHRMLKLDERIDRLLAQQIKPLREEKQKIKSKLHDRFGITARQINARYGLLQIESEMAQSGDKVQWEVMQDLYTVLTPFESEDLVDMMEKEAAKAEKVKAAEARTKKGDEAEGAAGTA